ILDLGARSVRELADRSSSVLPASVEGVTVPEPGPTTPNTSQGPYRQLQRRRRLQLHLSCPLRWRDDRGKSRLSCPLSNTGSEVWPVGLGLIELFDQPLP